MTIEHENAHALEDALVEKIEKKIEWLKERSEKTYIELESYEYNAQVEVLEEILNDINTFNEVGHF